MNIQWSHHGTDSQKAKRRSRVQSACVRCRRQKLRCDQERPCSLCLRSDVPCVSESIDSDRRRRKSFHRQGQPQRTDDIRDHNGRRDETIQDIDWPSIPGNGDRTDDSSPNAGTEPVMKGEKTPVSLDTIAPTAPEAYNQRISSVGLTQQIIDDFSPETVLGSSTSALPGGIGGYQRARGKRHDQVALDKLLSFELPSKQITDYLLKSYLEAVHWFMLLFHEPTLRASYEALIISQRCPQSRSNHLIFILLLLCLGAHYADESDVRQKFPSFDLIAFQEHSLKKVEDSLNSLYDAAGIESVQVCVLLGSFYMYHGRPNRAFVILGAALKCAQLMSLHKESSWRWLSSIAKEERRRAFWALFVFDRFAATIFGRPCGIPLDDIEVKIPESIGDVEIQHPLFKSTIKMPDGVIAPVTTFSYVKFKFRFYQISSPIIGDLYFHRGSNIADLASKISRIHEELVHFRDSLPPELKLDELCRNPDEPVTAETRPFILQALALQVAYDNVQILLHRPLLSQDLREFKDAPTTSKPDHVVKVASIQGRLQGSADVHHILLSSRDRCWESAMRSSNIGKYRQCLVSARESHAAAFLGINLFTAGMVLCIIALSRPLSSQAQTAKQAVARIMALSRFLSGRVLLSAQTTKILKDLVRLIGDKEVKAILSGPEVFDNLPGTETQSSGSESARPISLVTSLPAATSQQHDDATMLTGSAQQMQQPPPNSSSAPDLSDIYSFDWSGADSFEHMDFNDGLYTLQQAMFPASTVGTPNLNRPALNPSDTWNPDQYNADHAFIDSTSGSENGLQGTDFDMMNTVGQTWLWDSMSWNT